MLSTIMLSLVNRFCSLVKSVVTMLCLIAMGLSSLVNIFVAGDFITFGGDWCAIAGEYFFT